MLSTGSIVSDGRFLQGAKLCLQLGTSQTGRHTMRSKRHSQGKESPEPLSQGFASTCSVLAVGLFALTFVFQNFVIPSSSMPSTLIVVDHVVVERETPSPPQGGR